MYEKQPPPSPETRPQPDPELLEVAEAISNLAGRINIYATQSPPEPGSPEHQRLVNLSSIANDLWEALKGSG